MKVPDATLVAVATNSIRHLNEADDQFKARRFASALSSAILCIEETGKLFYLAYTGSSSTNHRVKQLPFVLLPTLIESMTWVFYWQKILKQGLEAEEVLSDELTAFISKNAEFADFVAALRAGKLTEVQERANAFAAATLAMGHRDGTFERHRPWMEGELHKKRLQATYVDVNASGEVTSDPSAADPEFVEKLCNGALLLLMLAMMFCLPRDQAIHLVGNLHPDITGIAILNPLNDLIKVFVEAKKTESQMPAPISPRLVAAQSGQKQ